MPNAEQVLVAQLPYYFRPVLEFQSIMAAHGWALDQLDSLVSRIWKNNYITTCDEQTVAFWEGILGLTYNAGDTLDFRKERILQQMSVNIPFSIGYLKARLNVLYGEDGYELSVNSKACTLTIKVTSDRYGAVDLLYDLLWDVVPAHMEIIANQEATDIIESTFFVGIVMRSAKVQIIRPAITG